MAIPKGTPEFEMWGDLFKFKSKYTPAPTTQDGWMEMNEDMRQLGKKYEGTGETYTLLYALIVQVSASIERLANAAKGEINGTIR